jgi:hypothetical protein
VVNPKVLLLCVAAGTAIGTDDLSLPGTWAAAITFTAIAASLGVTSIAIVATYLRFTWHIQDDGVFPWAEMFGTLALVADGRTGRRCRCRFCDAVDRDIQQ